MLRAFQWDLARQVERLDVLLDLLPRYADWGYQEVYLHLEDAVHYPSLPEIARADAYTTKEMDRLVTAAQKVGIGVVPIVNLLGHTQYVIKTERWRDLNERRAPDGSPLPHGQICPLHPEVPDLIERLLRDTAPWCTAGKLHAGLDESFHLGRCPRCREEVAAVGLGGHFARHVHRIHEKTAARGLRLCLWADMLALFPETIPELPRGLIAYDWYYYPFQRHPKVELYNFREYNLLPALRKQDITWWACPMNGAFRYEPLPVFTDRLANLRSWWQRATKENAEGLLVTGWEPYRLALAAPTLVDATAATLWLEPNKGTAADAPWLSRGLARLNGRRPSAGTLRAAKSLLAADKYPFSGYFEWEAHQRWDGGLTATPPTELARVVEHFQPIPVGLPPPLAASLVLRRYFARRAWFVREAADTVASLRQSLRLRRPQVQIARLLVASLQQARGLIQSLAEARAAAEVMWLASRSATQPSPNQHLLFDDLVRLNAWLDWLQAVHAEPAKARLASPVFGRWRFQFEIHNIEPAVQRVRVEAREPDGTWRELAGRHTIEFQSTAAAEHSTVRRAFVVSIDALDTPLRLACSGTGRVRIDRLFWTDGVDVHAAKDAQPFILGLPAPCHGLPALELTSDVREIKPA